MTDNQHIDKQFRDRQHDWDARPEDAAWHRLSDRLDSHRSGNFRRRRMLYRSTAAACVSILLALSIYMFNNSFDPQGFQAQHVNLELSEETNEGPQADRNGDSADNTQSEEPAPGAAVSKGPTERHSRSIAKDDAEIPEVRSITRQSRGNSKETLVSDNPASINSAESTAAAVSGAGSEHAEAIDKQEESVIIMSPDVYEIQPSISDDEAADPDLDELKALTDAVVANQAGIEAQKKEHRSDSGKDGKQRRTTSYTDSKGFKSAEMQEQTEDYSLPGTFPEAKSAGTGQAFTSTTLTILVPSEKGETCKFVSFRLQGDEVFIDNCSSGRSEIEAADAQPAGPMPVVTDIYDLGLEKLKQMEAETKAGPCLPSVNSVRFIFRISTAMSYYEETIRLPLQEFCLPENARPLVRDLVQLRDRYSK